MQLPHAFDKGCMRRAGNEDVELGQVVGMRRCGRKEVVRRKILAVQSSMVCSQAPQCACVLSDVSDVTPAASRCPYHCEE